MKTGSHRSNRRSIMLSFLASGVALSCLVSPLAYGRITIEPRIDAREVFSDNINASVDGFRDAGIISVIQPGVSVTVTSAKIEASLDYNIAFRQPLFAKTNGSQINHNLVARGAAKLIDDFLFLNAGAVVTQLFRNPQGSVTLNPDSLSSNLNHVGTFYIEPSIRRRLNQYVNLTINTQAGLTVLRDQPDNLSPLVDPKTLALSPGNFQNQPGSSSDNESASASLQSGDAFQRYKWELKAAWSRDKRRYLNELNNDYSGILNAEVPIVRGFALVGSAGYENTKDVEDVIVLDSTNRPVIQADGTLQIDRSFEARNGISTASNGTGGFISRDGRIIDRKGFVWDAGFHWNPSRRTDLTVRGGARFGTANINVNGFHKFSEHSSVTVSYSTNLDSLSRLLTRSINYSNGLSGTQVQNLGQRATPVLLPLIGFDPINGGYTGSLAINNATYLQRTARLSYTYDRPKLNVIASIFGEDRKLLSIQYLPGQVPILPGTIPNDISYGSAITIQRHLDKTHTITADIDFRYSKYSLNQSREDYLYGGAIGYKIDFTPKIKLETRYLFSRRDTNVPGFNVKENSISVGLGVRF